MEYFSDKELKKLRKDLEKGSDTTEFKKALQKMLDMMEDLSKSYNEFDAQLAEIDEDLAELEEYVYMGEKAMPKLEFEPNEDLGFELKCPSCNKLVTINLADSRNDKIVCPLCKAELNFGDGCSGDCGGCHGCGDE